MITPFFKFQCKEDVISFLDDDSKLVYPICDNLLFFFRKMIDVSENVFFVVEQSDAPILGLFHKQVRLFGHYIDAYKANNSDICMLLNRVIYEAYIKMRYLIDHPEDIDEYRALAFKPHLNIVNDDKFSNTPNLNVIRTKFVKDIEIENLSVEKITNARIYPGVNHSDKCKIYTKMVSMLLFIR